MEQISLLKYQHGGELVVVYRKCAGVTLFCLQNKAVGDLEYSLSCGKVGIYNYIT